MHDPNFRPNTLRIMLEELSSSKISLIYQLMSTRLSSCWPLLDLAVYLVNTYMFSLL